MLSIHPELWHKFIGNAPARVSIRLPQMLPTVVAVQLIPNCKCPTEGTWFPVCRIIMSGKVEQYAEHSLTKALQQFYTAKVAAKQDVLVRAMPADCANAHSTRFWVYPV